MENESEVRILVVDDRPDKAKALQILIADLGLVMTVQSGRDALRCLLQHDFALILLDVNMPDMDGFETAALIRQRPSFERTPIIFITSFHDSDNHASRGYSLGAVDYILAPVIPEVLRAKVSVFADLYRKAQEVKRRTEERLLLQQEQAARNLAEESGRRATFLAHASRVLASSMDCEILRNSLADLVTEHFADFCCIDLTRTDGSLERKVCRLHSERSELNVPMIHWPGCAEGRLAFLPELTESAAASQGFRPEAVSQLLTLPFKSLIAAPIQARNEMMGYLVLAQELESSRSFTSLDIPTTQDLAQRIGISLDHALVYHEAQEANRIKDEFLAVVSHELRTPLTPILGWTKILSTAPLDTLTLKRGLDVIDRNIKAQTKLIDDLLDISRIITGKLRLNLRKVDLKRVVDFALDSLRPAASAKNIALESQGVSRLDLIVDPSRLQQVLWNLIFNAIKFTQQNGRIEVQWARVDSQVEIKVKDNGRGISSRFLPFVFDRFRQADSSSTRSDSGLGIGLSITRHLVELHGGTVAVTSEGENKGAIFIVRLPLGIENFGEERAPRYPASEREALAANVPDLSGLHFLVVDDNLDARELMKVLLVQTGAQISTAESVDEAMPIFEHERIDLLICDLAMPKEDGFSMIQKVRAHERGYAVPAIALSAYCRDQDVQNALNCGFNQHIAKPADPSELFANIKILTGRIKDSVPGK